MNPHHGRNQYSVLKPRLRADNLSMVGQPASFIVVVMIDDDVVCVKTKNARGL